MQVLKIEKKMRRVGMFRARKTSPLFLYLYKYVRVGRERLSQFFFCVVEGRCDEKISHVSQAGRNFSCETSRVTYFLAKSQYSTALGSISGYLCTVLCRRYTFFCCTSAALFAYPCFSSEKRLLALKYPRV